MYKTILVPTDFSEPAEKAWEHAVSLARQTGAKLVALYVAEPVLSHYGVVGLIPSVKELEEQNDIASRLKLQELEEGESKSGVEVSGEVATGKPWQAIIETAEAKKADLIIMGTHGRTGLAHETIGSTAERVIRKASCPVLIIPPH